MIENTGLGEKVHHLKYLYLNFILDCFFPVYDCFLPYREIIRQSMKGIDSISLLSCRCHRSCAESCPGVQILLLPDSWSKERGRGFGTHINTLTTPLFHVVPH